MKRTLRLLKYLSALLITVYAGICVYFFMVQDEIIFRPDKLPADYSYDYSFRYEERWFESSDGTRIHALLAKADTSRGLVIYFHGNRGSTRTDPYKFDLFLSRGYDVLYPDYRGYGKSEGEITNGQEMVEDMRAVYRQIRTEYSEDRIIVLGYSLGTGFASLVSEKFDPVRVVLWAPYYSMVDMKDHSYPYLPDFLVRFPLRTDLALQNIEETVSIFYAAKDEILPVERSIRLQEYLKEGDQTFILQNQRHGRIYNNPKLIEEMNRILSQ